ncbi:hypothetical protein LCGC14_1843030, partial [marine sediment metagenome]
MYKILIIEDNPDIVANIYAFFETKGFELDNAHNGISGLTLASNNRYDVILLDVMLPGMDGTKLCKALREELHNKTPVLMLTARDTILDKVTGFDSGADDYLVKPFAFAELLARIEAILRRQQSSTTQTKLKVADLEMDLLAHKVKRSGESFNLQPREYKLLEYLMKHAGQVVTRTMLLENVWEYHFDPQTNVIDVHISRLRQKIDKGFDKQLLSTVRGAG